MKIKINTSLFLISFSIFIYQVSLLRILSVADFYHFAFLIVSISLLGFGISGSFLPFFVNRIKDEKLLLLIFSLFFSISIVVSYFAINIIPFDSFKIAWEIKQVFYLFVYYLFLILPFFFGGSFIGYIFYGKQKPQITYFFNLAGSSFGALAFLILVPSLNQSGITILASFLGITSMFILSDRKHIKKFVIAGIVFISVVLSLFVFLPLAWEIKMSPYKSLETVLRYPDSSLIYTREDSGIRIDVVESNGIKSAPGLSLLYKDLPPEQLGLTIDGDNLTPVTRVEGSNLKFLEYLPQAVFMNEEEYKNILIIEPGGGLDVLCCLYYGNSNIYVVQNNKLIIELLEKDLASYSGNIYNDSRVKIEENSIRNFSLNTDMGFDLIIISLSDSFHPVSSGAYSLNENYIYSKESISTIIKLLSRDGMLAITRWVQSPPSENLKMISTLVSTSDKDVSGNIFSYRSWSTLTTIYKNSSFCSNEIDELKTRVDNLNYDLVYYRSMEEKEANKYSRLEEPYFYRFFKLIIEGDSATREKIYQNYYFNIEPPTDNNPYFFNFFKPAQIPDIIKYFGKSTQPFGGGGYLILIAALLISIFLSIVFIILPVKTTGSQIKLKKDYGYLIYFLSLGMGFFFIELPLMQKFILVLGKPSYSVAIILFSIMLFGGLGSFFTGYHKINLLWVVLALIIYTVFFMLTFRFTSELILSRPLWQRFVITILLLAPPGFLMGIPFPAGIARAKKNNRQIISWLWAINGCASVISSIAAVIISIHFGYTIVVVLSSLFYLTASLLYKKML
jgi:spermidine synthase